MALDFSGVPNRNSNSNKTNSSNEQRPSAQVWINVGYEAEFTNAEGNNEKRFISLPVNLAVDTMEPLKINSQNQVFNDQQSARNDLLQMILESAKQNNPGEGRIINLQVQLFRANEKIEPTSSSENPFGFKKTL